MKTGNSRVGGMKYKKKNHFKLKDGDQVFRILPPFSEINETFPNLGLPDNNFWSRYYSVHFGYKNTEGKLRPFNSPLVKNSKTKMVESPDAALDRLNDFKAKLQQAREEGNGALGAKLNTLVGFKGVYSVDNNHHMNVVDLQGNIGELKIRYKAKTLLDAEIKKLEAEGTDPLSLEDGRFFVFTRSGNANETNFKVSVYTEKVDVPGFGRMDRPVVHKVGPEILNRLKTEAFDLSTIFNKLTSEEVAEIVSTSDILSGKSPACDKYFDARWKAKRTENANQTVVSDDGETLGEETQDSDEQSAVSASTFAPTLASLTAQALNVSSNKPAVSNKSVEDLSDEEFFKMIETNN
jgi:hypothetical protein